MFYLSPYLWSSKHLIIKLEFSISNFRMGNPAMPIDRYDVRGLLSDLSKYEAKNLDPNLKYSDYLSPEDALVIRI